MAYEDANESRELDSYLSALDLDLDLMDAEDQQPDKTQELLGVVPAPSTDALCAVGQAPSEGGSGDLQSGEGPSHGPSYLPSQSDLTHCSDHKICLFGGHCLCQCKFGEIITYGQYVAVARL